MKSNDNRLTAVVKLLTLTIALLTGLSFTGEVAGLRPVRLYGGLTAKKGADDRSVDSLLWAQMQLPVPAKQDTVPAKVPIEDFSENGNALAPFFDALDRRDSLGRPVRIAFLGDSFIEGDILTSDLREYLQARYGGGGVGFVPLAPVDLWRNTLYVDHGGWNILSSLYGGQSAPYLLNGQCFIPADSTVARTTVRAVGEHPHARAFNTAALLYSADSAATLHYKLGAAEEREAELRPGTLRLHKTSRTGMRTATFRVDAPAGFTGYGLLLNNETGVCVDNYSLRSSTGMQLLRTGPRLLAQMQQAVPYDLVVLQYGMNVLEAERTDYTTYTGQIARVVARLREAMPGVPIVIFGVGDRNFKDENGEMVTKVGVTSLVEAQRRVAQETGAAFWNTYLAMGGRGGMSAFVNSVPPLANKDYTHINYAGGRRLGLAFGEALTDAYENK